MTEYILKDAEARLSRSGLARMIMDSNGPLDIEYRTLPREVYSNKHTSRGHPEGRGYHSFLKDAIWAVICVAPDPHDSRIELAQKCLRMNEQAVKKFAEGWGILEERHRQQTNIQK
jgi:hypothetical protein